MNYLNNTCIEYKIRLQFRITITLEAVICFLYMNGTWKWILPVIKYNTCWTIFTYKARTYNNVRETTQFVQMTLNFTFQRLHNIWLMFASLFNTHPGMRRMWYMWFNKKKDDKRNESKTAIRHYKMIIVMTI